VRRFTIWGWDFVLGSFGAGFWGAGEEGVGLEAARGWAGLAGGWVVGDEGCAGFVLGVWEGEDERGEPP